MDSILALIILLLLASPSWSVIAHDADSNSGGQGASPFTWSHTITGTNPVLVVGVTNDVGAGTPVTVSALTWNSVACTFVRRDVGSFTASEIWYCKAPTTGTHTISVSFTGTAGASDFIVGGAVSLTGVDQITPLDASNGANNTTGTSSVSVTTVADNSWIVDCGETDDTGTATKGASQTQAWQISQGVQFGSAYGSYSGPWTPAGSKTVTWTHTAAQWVHSAASFKPAGGAAAATPMRTLMGVGQ